tara:strand:+ start:270 stop:743 length:474 start_codon:yes stop_codon:yes gene_type:complete
MSLLEKHFTGIQNSVLLKKDRDFIFSLLEKAFFETIGHKLFTILKFDKNSFTLERIFTNKPYDYPLFGIKNLQKSFWQKSVLEEGKIYIGYNSNDIKNSFHDYDIILKLGCESVMNIPIVQNEIIKGSVNILHKKNWYSKRHIQSAKLLTSFINNLI